MTCPNCKSPVYKTIEQSHGRIVEYQCGSWETFIQGIVGPVKKTWACNEIKRLKEEVSHAEACADIDRIRFFRD